MLTQQMQDSGVRQVLAMGTIAVSAADPLGVNATQQIARLVPGVFAVGVADPVQTDADHLHWPVYAIALVTALTVGPT